MFVLYLAGVVVGFVIYVGELVYNKVVLKGVDPNTGAYPLHHIPLLPLIFTPHPPPPPLPPLYYSPSHLSTILTLKTSLYILPISLHTHYTPTFNPYTNHHFNPRRIFLLS